MSVHAVSSVLAVLAILGAVFTVLVIVGFVLSFAGGFFWGLWELFRDALDEFTLPLAGVVASVATAGSLYYSEVADFPPCELCWYQRIAMYPLSLTLLTAAVTRRREIVPYLLPLPIVGFGIASWHHYEELNPDRFQGSCRFGVPCTTKWIEELGFVTIPVLAGIAFALITVLLLMAWRQPGREPEQRPRTRGGW